MANNDAELNIGTKIDTSGLKKGTTEIKNQLDKVGKTSKTNTKNIDSFIKSAAGIGTTFAAAAVGLKKTVDALEMCNEAYKTQIKAEASLEAAAKNNPYINGESVKNLKEFASNVQSFTTYGDEQLLQLMTQLIASGRTEAETMNVINAAVNIAAAGTMSLESAVTSLNGTFSGNSGLLSKYVGSIKDLTTEELKAGKAVDAVAKSYDGMAAKMGEIELKTQKNNARGDFMEELGALVNPFSNSWNDFWLKFYQRAAAAAKKARTEASGSGNLEGFYDQGSKAYNSAAQGGSLKDLTDEQLQSAIESAEFYEAKYKTVVDNINNSLNNFAETRQAELEKKYKKNIENWSEAQINAFENEIQTRQSQLNTELESFNRSYSTATGAEWNQGANNKIISGANSELESRDLTRKRKAAYTSAENELVAALAEIDTKSETEKLDAQLKALEEYYAAWEKLAGNDKEKRKQIEEEYNAAHKTLSDKRQAIIDAEAEAAKQKTKDAIQNVVNNISSYTDSFAEIVSGAVELGKDQVESQEEYQLAALKKQYQDGIISEEEYTEKKEQIEKESAEKTYQLELYNWETQILQATASGALAVVNALSTAGNIYAGIAMAAVATAMTGIELGTLIASKPVKPSFATGGIVPGASYTGDNVEINANSREAVLTLSQQKRLLALADGSTSNGSGAVLNMPISIENSVSDTASVDIEKRLDQIKIMVRQQTKDDIKNGLYNSELMTAQGSYRGRKYTN